MIKANLERWLLNRKVILCMSHESGKAVKAGVGYTIGNILIKGIGFLTLPLFSRLMTTEEFGVYNVFVSYEAILYVVVGLAIHSSVRSANIEFKNKRDEYTSSVSILYLFNGALLFALVVCLREPLTAIFNFPASIIYLMILYSFSTALIALYNNWISLEYSYKKYINVALVTSLGNVFLSLIFIVTIFKEKKALGRIFAASCTGFFVSIYILIMIYRKTKPVICKAYWKFAIKYSLPVVPHGISQVLLGQFDRIMIRQIEGDALAGIYSFAGNIKLILTIVTDSIGSVWSTWFYEKMEENNIAEIQKRATQLCALFSIFTIGLMAISSELILILGGEKYAEAEYVAIPMIIDAFVLFLYTTIIPSEYYTKKTKFIMWGTLIAAIINVVTNYIFINLYGYIAAAYTTLFSYLCYLVLHMLISRKVIGFNVIPLKWMGCFLGLITVIGIIDLFFSFSVLIRWGICGLIVIPLIIVLAKESGIGLRKSV